MIRWMRIVGGIGVLMIATVVAAIAVIGSTDFNSFKGDIQAEVKAATGRELVIGGDIGFELGLVPKLSVQGVTLANADWGSGPVMLHLDRAEARVRLWPLLFGDVEVVYLVLNGLEVVLETGTKGRANWEFASAAAPQDDGGPTLPQIHDVRFTDAKLTYIDKAAGTKHVVQLDHMKLNAADLDAPMYGVMEGSMNGVAFEAGAELGSLGQMVQANAGAFPIVLTLNADGLDAELDGSVDQPGDTAEFSFDVIAEVTRIDSLASLIAMPLPRLGHMSLKTRVSGQGAKARLTDLRAAFGTSNLTGSASIDYSGPVPSVTAKFASRHLDLNELFEHRPGAKGGNGEAKGKRVFSADPLPLEGLGALNASIDFAGEEVLADILTMTKVDLKVRLKDKRLVIKPLKFRLGRGGLTGTAVVNAAKPTARVQLGITADKLDIGKLLKEFDIAELMTLAIDGKLNVKGGGKSMRAVMGSLNGNISIDGKGGRIISDDFKSMVKGFGEAMAWTGREDANAIRCLIARIPISKGTATAKTLVLDTNGMTLTGSGTLNLKREVLDLDLVPDAKNVGLGSFAVPVKISGTLMNPEAGITAVSAVAGTVKNIVKTPAKAVIGIMGGIVEGVTGEQPKARAAQDPCRRVKGR